MKRKQLILGVAIGVIIAALLAIFKPTNKQEQKAYNGIPTLFVHGYKGTILTFAKMFIRLTKNYELGTRGITYIVNPDGTMQKRSFTRLKGRPQFIQVVFKNNRASFAETTNYLAAVMRDVRKTYHIEKVNVVGHSMGGIVSVKYAQEYVSRAYPKIEKLVCLGSPFAGIHDEDYFIFHKDAAADDLKVKSDAYRKMRKLDFPKNIAVLNIGSTGDTRALPKSVKALREIVPLYQLRERMIQDEKLSHSGLHEDERVDELIYRFLWKDSV